MTARLLGPVFQALHRKILIRQVLATAYISTLYSLPVTLTPALIAIRIITAFQSRIFGGTTIAPNSALEYILDGKPWCSVLRPLLSWERVSPSSLQFQCFGSMCPWWCNSHCRSRVWGIWLWKGLICILLFFFCCRRSLHQSERAKPLPWEDYSALFIPRLWWEVGVGSNVISLLVRVFRFSRCREYPLWTEIRRNSFFRSSGKINLRNLLDSWQRSHTSPYERRRNQSNLKIAPVGCSRRREEHHVWCRKSRGGSVPHVSVPKTVDF